MLPGSVQQCLQGAGSLLPEPGPVFRQGECPKQVSLSPFSAGRGSGAAAGIHEDSRAKATSQDQHAGKVVQVTALRALVSG